MEERTRLLRDVSGWLETPAIRLRVCDVGCGTGLDLEGWLRAGVPATQLAGSELMPERAEAASRRIRDADIRLVEGFDLPFPSGTFDLCSASLVLSTIRGASNRRRLLAEMARVTRPSGLVIVYDFVIRKPTNRNVVRITTRGLTRMWRAPDAVFPAAPFLPLLEAALKLPRSLASAALRLLPRTHRLWVWRVPAHGANDDPSDSHAPS
jgi:SAM-dependent methyltransferase